MSGPVIAMFTMHGAAELAQFQRLRPFNVGVVLEPLLMAVEFGDRSAGAVGNLGEQGTFDIEPEMPFAGLLPNDVANAQGCLEGFQHVEVAIRPNSDQAQFTAGTDDFFR